LRDAAELEEIDVRAAEDDQHLFPGEPILFRECGGERARAVVVDVARIKLDACEIGIYLRNYCKSNRKWGE
jgi:hypothetical protein